jgi:hypothetical protein
MKKRKPGANPENPAIPAITTIKTARASTLAETLARKLHAKPRQASGNDFSRAGSAKNEPGLSQAAEKLDSASCFQGFVSGHDFSRADKANRMSWALAPAKARYAILTHRLEFFRSLFCPGGNAFRGSFRPSPS